MNNVLIVPTLRLNNFWIFLQFFLIDPQKSILYKVHLNFEKHHYFVPVFTYLFVHLQNVFSSQSFHWLKHFSTHVESLPVIFEQEIDQMYQMKIFLKRNLMTETQPIYILYINEIVFKIISHEHTKKFTVCRDRIQILKLSLRMFIICFWYGGYDLFWNMCEEIVLRFWRSTKSTR